MRVQRAAFCRPLHSIPVGRRARLVDRLQSARSASVLQVAPCYRPSSTTTTTLFPVHQDARDDGPDCRASHDQLRTTLFRTASSAGSRDLGQSHVMHNPWCIVVITKSWSKFEANVHESEFKSWKNKHSGPSASPRVIVLPFFSFVYTKALRIDAFSLLTAHMERLAYGGMTRRRNGPNYYGTGWLRLSREN